MNKITSTLTGLAIVATASIAPAFAQGNLFTPASGGPFTFATTTSAGATTFTAGGTADFNPIGATTTTTAAFALTGTLLGGNLFQVNTLTITPTGGSPAAFTETGTSGLNGGAFDFFVNALPNGGVAVSSVGAAADQTTFNLVNPNPVPEASTVISFGALLALGGLAVLRRKSVKNAA